jgi:hypothetical protein
VIARWPVITDSRIAEVVHVLDEALNRLPNLLLPLCLPFRPKPLKFITSERFMQYLHQRAIPRKEDGMSCGGFIPASSRHIQAHQSLPGTRHSRNEDKNASMARLCLIN